MHRKFLCFTSCRGNFSLNILRKGPDSLFKLQRYYDVKCLIMFPIIDLYKSNKNVQKLAQ